MDLFQAIETRRSIRRYASDEVPDEDIVKIIHAAGQAPSASNQQQWRFVVVKNKDVISKMGELVRSKIEEMLSWPESAEYVGQVKGLRGYGTFFTSAPVVIVILDKPYAIPLTDELLIKRGMSFQDIYELRGDSRKQSLGASIQNLLLAAHALGYGACWMTAPLYAGAELSTLLDVPAGWRISAVVPLGRPSESPSARSRKPLDDILTWVR